MPIRYFQKQRQDYWLFLSAVPEQLGSTHTVQTPAQFKAIRNRRKVAVSFHLSKYRGRYKIAEEVVFAFSKLAVEIRRKS